MDKLLKELRKQCVGVTFKAGQTFCWSPKAQAVTYASNQDSLSSMWSLLHETSHAILNHTTYITDFELLNMEVAAWEHAKALGLSLGITIDEEHVQDCLDSYRDWLYGRSICPKCGNKSLQNGATRLYACFNCHTTWRVAPSRFCRTYRTSKPASHTPLTMLHPPAATY